MALGGNTESSSRVSTWLLWLAAMIAGPARGSRSRLTTSAPVRSRAIGRASRRRNQILNGLGLVGGEGIVGQDVEVERRGAGQAVDPVQDAAVARDEGRGVLDPQVPLARRHGHVAGEPG